MGRVFALFAAVAAFTTCVTAVLDPTQTQLSSTPPTGHPVATRLLKSGHDDIGGKRGLRTDTSTDDGDTTTEERAISIPGLAKLTDKLKSNPTVSKYVDELKTIVGQLKNTAAYSKLIAKVEKLAAKVKALPGAAKIAEMYKKLKFYLWYKLNVTPDDIYKKFKLGAGGPVNTAKNDEYMQYKMFYTVSKREDALKKKPAAAATT
ncbi:hypothetical protein PHYBOEH_011065 [Phytophthora boehmeriae]|uniref:RxLR effector protein n=1 Tax=Phytophthora boehmeriae TaxID=109152 RepID=A0A8T1X7G9_9STRA|nr:hypothetical protein PHYBOEH_011065 [Phytophthora boehmeriae]